MPSEVCLEMLLLEPAALWKSSFFNETRRIKKSLNHTHNVSMRTVLMVDLPRHNMDSLTAPFSAICIKVLTHRTHTVAVYKQVTLIAQHVIIYCPYSRIGQN